jgi:predicted hotdog family 3-hydroxylacyl-ACP dehydratase
VAEGHGAAGGAPREAAQLPHAHPFRLLDRLADGSVGLLVSADAVWLRGADALPALLAVEVLAQAALVALPGPSADGAPSPRAGQLAGLEDVRLHSALRPGDRLIARATLRGRLGPLVKVHAELRRGDQTVVAGDLLLALTDVA